MCFLGRLPKRNGAGNQVLYVPFMASTGPVALWMRRCLLCLWHEAHFIWRLESSQVRFDSAVARKAWTQQSLAKIDAVIPSSLKLSVAGPVSDSSGSVSFGGMGAFSLRSTGGERLGLEVDIQKERSYRIAILYNLRGASSLTCTKQQNRH